MNRQTLITKYKLCDSETVVLENLISRGNWSPAEISEIIDAFMDIGLVFIESIKVTEVCWTSALRKGCHIAEIAISMIMSIKENKKSPK